MTTKEILTEAYKIAENLDFGTVSNTVKEDVDVLIDKIDNANSA